MGVGAHAAEFDFEEFDEVGIGHRAVVGEVPGVDLSELLYENEELLMGCLLYTSRCV